MSTQNLLVELFVEELPPKALKKLGDAFAASMELRLRCQNLLSEGSQVTSYASPRRLAVHVSSVMAIGVQRPKRVKLMPLSIALDASGQPTAAFIKKLDSLGLNYLLNVDSSVWDERVSQEIESGKAFLFHTDVAAGSSLVIGLQIALDETLSQLPIQKMMTYQLADGWTSVNFVRPAHGLVALHGADVVPVTALGLAAGRETHGHRFEATQDPVLLDHADDYAARLEQQGAVIASFAARRDEITRQLQAAAAIEALTPIADAALLDEVTALVERPNVLLCQFEPEFLAVPPECLILTMKANQKYFPLLDAAGALTNKFLVVSNIRPADPSRVIGGNERVVRPRLADAKFFFDQDRKKTLASRVAGLSKVVYHNQLGSQGERVQRVRSIARAIGEALGGPALSASADRAALLAKADLLTDMVGEFPELQGVMGAYYARHDAETDAVADAIEDHYKPRFAGDELPRGQTGLALALADKLETLGGLFGIGQVPTGDRDPFALRRHALGVIRMLVERELPLEVDTLVGIAVGSFGDLVGDRANTVAAVVEFIFDRLTASLRDQAYSAQEVDAVLALRPQKLSDIAGRLAAVRVFASLPEAQSLAAANKRVGNILRKSEAAVGAFSAGSLVEPAEQALYEALGAVGALARRHLARGDYTQSLRALAALRGPADGFFDTVMVNAPEDELRNNRLWLLKDLHGEMNRIADLSKLAP